MEKIKAFVSKYKWFAVALGAALVMVVYKLFFSQSGEASTGTVQGFTPAASSGGGGSSASPDNTGQVLSAIKDVISDSQESQAVAAEAQQESQNTFMSGLVSTIGSFMSGVQDTLKTQTKTTADAIKNITQNNADFQRSMKDLMEDSMELLKTPAVMPDVPIPKSTYSSPSRAVQQEDPYDNNIGKKVVDLQERIRSTGKPVVTSTIVPAVQTAQNKTVQEKMKAERPEISFDRFVGTPGL